MLSFSSRLVMFSIWCPMSKSQCLSWIQATWMSVLYAMSETYNGVQRFLEEINLGKYWDIFKAKGYDRESDVLDLDTGDLDKMHIENIEDRGRIMNAGEYALTGFSFNFSYIEQVDKHSFNMHIRLMSIHNIVTLRYCICIDLA